ncbi:hypothetical protein RHD99_14005 [Buttiauxella selenatireducens]|uniref:Uncharacterized protein n=1 Tax=Buttiauxella selenatireducens TaxID=3073902 RepID=A0ABY9S6G6_9ENTR|nr:hypothetical protein [Buttiauxella sp. R73]WMY72593.1 hypothetical protein RHD99_14005 [Buttiauxella sp. R73]
MSIGRTHIVISFDCKRYSISVRLLTMHVLYVLVTAAVRSGKIVAITTNYNTGDVGSTYFYRSQYMERDNNNSILNAIRRKELQTSRRDVVFNIDYGAAIY